MAASAFGDAKITLEFGPTGGAPFATMNMSLRATDDPLRQMSVIYDNRSRIATRLKQVRTGKRHAQAPPSNLRRLLSNIEFLGGRANRDGGVDLEVAANFLVLESRARNNNLWGGRTTYRLRRTEDGLRLAYKKVVLVDNDKPLSTLSFLI